MAVTNIALKVYYRTVSFVAVVIFPETSNCIFERGPSRAHPMRTLLNHPAIGLLARLVVGGIFVMYAADKIAAPSDFALSIERYELLPLAAVNLLAIVLPWIELVVGVFLVAGVRVRASAIVAAGLLGVFILAIALAMARGLEINCGCSAHSETVGWGKILEDGMYLLLALRLVVRPDSLWTFDSYARMDAPQAIAG